RAGPAQQTYVGLLASHADSSDCSFRRRTFPQPPEAIGKGRPSLEPNRRSEERTAAPSPAGHRTAETEVDVHLIDQLVMPEDADAERRRRALLVRGAHHPVRLDPDRLALHGDVSDSVEHDAACMLEMDVVVRRATPGRRGLLLSRSEASERGS